MKAIIICGFPGIGKTHACFHSQDVYNMLDLDSSLFTQDPAWIFPEDYIKALDEVIGWPGEPDFIFMSTHEGTRQELHDAGLPFVNVFPSATRKQSIIDRITEREQEKEQGNPALAGIVEANYDTWIRDLKQDTRAALNMELDDTQSLVDVLPAIKRRMKP